jgi:hypothetical protein
MTQQYVRDEKIAVQMCKFCFKFESAGMKYHNRDIIEP